MITYDTANVEQVREMLPSSCIWTDLVFGDMLELWRP